MVPSKASLIPEADGALPKGLHTNMQVGDIETFNSLRGQWESLVQLAAYNEPFLNPRWFQAYAHAFEPEAKITLLTIHQDQLLRGIIPLVQKRRCFGLLPARTWRSFSGKHSCRFDCIVSNQHRSSTIAAAWEALESEKSWDVLEAFDVPDGAAFQELTSFATKDGYLVARWPTLCSPYLRIPVHGEDPYTHCPRRYRKARNRLKHSLRRLASQGTVMFECATTDYADALNRFIRIEMSGWKGARGSAIGCSDRTLLFYKRIADEFAEAGKLRMYTLWLDHTAIAMELGLVTDGTYFSPKATYDERFASFSPGHLLTQHIISDLACTNISKYDFLGPHARHKALWAGEVLPHANYRIFRPSFLGHMRHLLVGEIAPLIRRAKRTLLADPQQRPLSNSVI